MCKVDQSILPDDAEFKGYEKVVVQEIIIKTDNVEYMKEIYYSPSQHKTYMGKLPPEIEGEFGPGVKSLVCTLKHVANVSEPKIHEFFDNFGIYISPAKISRIITKDNELFHQEKADIFMAGLLSTDYQQIDDTCSRVHWENHYTQIVCNCEAFLIKLFLKVFTTPLSSPCHAKTVLPFSISCEVTRMAKQGVIASMKRISTCWKDSNLWGQNEVGFLGY